jgi:hypothetical protein
MIYRRSLEGEGDLKIEYNMNGSVVKGSGCYYGMDSPIRGTIILREKAVEVNCVR